MVIDYSTRDAVGRQGGLEHLARSHHLTSESSAMLPRGLVYCNAIIIFNLNHSAMVCPAGKPPNQPSACSPATSGVARTPHRHSPGGELARGERRDRAPDVSALGRWAKRSLTKQAGLAALARSGRKSDMAAHPAVTAQGGCEPCSQPHFPSSRRSKPAFRYRPAA